MKLLVVPLNLNLNLTLIPLPLEERLLHEIYLNFDAYHGICFHREPLHMDGEFGYKTVSRDEIAK